MKWNFKIYFYFKLLLEFYFNRHLNQIENAEGRNLLFKGHWIKDFTFIGPFENEINCC